jgi:hypothetical protein
MLTLFATDEGLQTGVLDWVNTVPLDANHLYQLPYTLMEHGVELESQVIFVSYFWLNQFERQFEDMTTILDPNMVGGPTQFCGWVFMGRPLNEHGTVEKNDFQRIKWSKETQMDFYKAPFEVFVGDGFEIVSRRMLPNYGSTACLASNVGG